MKMFLDVVPILADRCREAGRAVDGLEWVTDEGDADALIIDKVPARRLDRAALFLGSLATLAGTDEGFQEWDEKLHVRFERRFEPELQSVYQSCRTGELGQLGLLRLHRWVAGPVAAAEREEDLLACVDLARWFFGELPVSVFALEGPSSATIQLHLGFSGNGMAMIDCAWDLPRGRGYDSCHVIGDDGAAYADDHRNVSLLYAGNDPQAHKVQNEQAAIVAVLDSFITSLDSAESPIGLFSELRSSKDILAGVRGSIASGQAVPCGVGIIEGRASSYVE